MLLSKNPTWQERQAQAELVLAQIEAEANPFSAPQIVCNPYGTAPLTAMVLFMTELPLSVLVKVYAPDGAIGLQYEAAAALQHRVPIYGLYAGCASRVVLQLEDGQEQELMIETQPLPDGMPQGQAQGVLPSDQWVFTVPLANDGQPAAAYPAAYDKDGQCRWYSTESMAYQISLSANGHLLTCGPGLLCPPYSAAAIREMDLLGRIYKEYRVPGGVCHGFFEMKNGNLLAIHQFFNRGTAADMCVELERSTGAIVKAWDFRTLLPMTKGASPSQSGSDWFHANGICYQEENDSITVSGKYQDIIVNIGYTSGQINWMLGDPTGWPQELVDSYFLQPAGDDFAWCYEPGTIQMLPGEKLLCFDNGHLRTKKGGTPLPAEERYSRAVCYQLNFADKTANQLWEYGKAAGNALYAPYLSSALMTEDDGCLINFGGIGVLNGAVSEPPAYFVQKDFPDVVMQTKIMLRHQEELVYQLELPVNCYYANLISASDCKAENRSVAGEVLGHWHGNDLYDLEMEWEDAGLLASSYELRAERTSEQLLLSGIFIQGEMVMLRLENETEAHSYYMQTTRAPYLTASAQTYAKGSQRPITYVVDLEPLSGKYEICICLDDKKYHTDLWVECA